MKKIRLIIWVGILFFLIGACTDDKGNYDYKEMNDVVISGIEAEYWIEQFTSLHIPVTITNSQKNFQEDQYEYLWYIWTVNDSDNEPDTLSFEKDLNVNAISVKIGEHALRYVVKDKETGLIYTKRAKINIVNSYSGGVLALSDVDGNANVTFINMLDTVIENAYQQVNGEIAGRDPRGIFITGDDRYVKKMLMISTGDGTKIVEPTDFSCMIDFSEMFYVTPSTSVLDFLCKGPYKEYAVLDGKIYQRQLLVVSSFYEKYSSQEKGDYEVAPFSVSGTNNPFFYDQKGKRFIYHNYTKVIPVESNSGVFNSADMGSIMIYGTSVEENIRAVMEEENGKRFAIAGKQEITYDLITYESFPRVLAIRKTELNKEGINEATCFAISSKEPDYLYYAYRNKIVCLGTQSGEVLATYNFEKDMMVDYMEFDSSKTLDRLYVGVSDGSARAKSGSIYYLKMNSDGRLTEECHFSNVCGKVVDFEYNE